LIIDISTQVLLYFFRRQAGRFFFFKKLDQYGLNMTKKDRIIELSIDILSFKHFTKRAPNGLSGALKFVIVMLALWAFGCATVSDMKREKRFEMTSAEYGKVVRWIGFETAYQYIKTGQAGEKTPDFKSLDRIKITSYDVRQSIPSKDQLQVLQIVDIRYYKTDEMIERYIKDSQLWEYDADKQTWHLVSGLPDFR